MSIGREIMDELMIQSALLEEHMGGLVHNKCWQTADKRILKICDMEEEHLLNTIKWLERNDDYYFADSFISIMKQELESKNRESKHETD